MEAVIEIYERFCPEVGKYVQIKINSCLISTKL